MVGSSVWLLSPIAPMLQRYGRGRVLLLVFSSLPAISLIINGQDSAVTLLILVASLRLLLARRDTAAGAILGLGGAFKPPLFLLMPLLLLFQRRWRALGMWFAVCGGLAAVSVVLLGPGGVRTYIRLLLEIGRRDSTLGSAWRTPSLFGLGNVVRAHLPRDFAIMGVAVTVSLGIALVAAWIREALHQIRAGKGSRWCTPARLWPPSLLIRICPITT